MKPRVLQLTSAHRWDDVRIFLKISQTLTQAGYDVLLMAPGDKATVKPEGCGVTVHLTPRRSTRLSRLLGASLLWTKAHRLKPSIVHLHDPELLPAGIVLRLLGHHVIYDVHEDYPRKVAEKDWIPTYLRPLARSAIATIEWVASRLFSATIAVTETIARRFNNRSTVVVRNYPILEECTRSPDEEHHVFSYVGGLDELRGVRSMVEAIGRVGAPSARLELLGTFSDQSLESWVTEQARRQPIDMLGWCDRATVARHLSKACAGLVVLHPTPAYEASLPIKLFEYMSAGIPVIASDFEQWRSIVQDNACGLLVDPLDVDSIAAAMRWIIDNPAEASAMGERGRRAVEETYNWNTETAALLGLYEKLASPHA